VKRVSEEVGVALDVDKLTFLRSLEAQARARTCVGKIGLPGFSCAAKTTTTAFDVDEVLLVFKAVTGCLPSAIAEGQGAGEILEKWPCPGELTEQGAGLVLHIVILAEQVERMPSCNLTDQHQIGRSAVVQEKFLPRVSSK